jgi:hypothetical protein
MGDAANTGIKPVTTKLYEADFYAWTQEQAALLRSGHLNEIDAEHLIEELESMGASDRRELLSRLQVLVLHLLKWQFQPERRNKSWLLTINHQRDAIDRLLKQSPSLNRLLRDPEEIGDVFHKAVREAVIETDIEKHRFPEECGYTVEQILGEDYLPD